MSVKPALHDSPTRARVRDQRLAAAKAPANALVVETVSRAATGAEPKALLSRPPLVIWAEVNWKALALAAAGLVLAFAAPVHRVDLLIIGLAAVIGGVAWSPTVGPTLIGASLPFFFFGRPLVGPVSVTPPGLMLAVTWLIALVRHRRLKLRLPSSPYDLPLAIFVVAALVSLVVTEYPLLSVRELRALILEPVLFFWLLRAMPLSPRFALVGFLAAATLTAVAAILQLPLHLGGTAAEGVTRAQAWYPSANHLALMLGRALPFVLAAALAGQRWLWLAVALVATGLLLTFSTGGWIGGLIGALVVVAFMSRRDIAVRIGLAGIVVLAATSILAISGVLPERLNPLRQTGGFRLDLWLSTLDMIRDHPFAGVGLDNFAYLYQQQYLREGAAAEPNLSHPHNWLLHFWVELGLLGVIAFGGLLVRFIALVRRPPIDSTTKWVFAGAIGAMADLLVHGAIDNSYFLVDLAFLFWLDLALVAARSAKVTIEPT